MTVTERGFSLVEALVAITIMLIGILSLAQLSTISTQANAAARVISLATLLAAEKVELLRSFDWDDAQLAPSPAGSLLADTPGYVDFIDERGGTLSGSTIGLSTPPAGAVYRRRWSIDALPANPNTVVLQVVVSRYPDRGPRDAVRMTAVRTRPVR